MQTATLSPSHSHAIKQSNSKKTTNPADNLTCEQRSSNDGSTRNIVESTPAVITMKCTLCKEQVGNVRCE
ncbi:unnamed protein product, partial [Rotaria sordida]